MAKGMTFNAVLKLQKQQFDKGIKSVQATLKGLQKTFMSVAGALGAGLGLGQLLTGLKNTAVQLSVAKNTLENVSHVSKEWGEGIEKNTVIISNYAENLEFVRGLSRKYSQDLTTLIQSFAQFHAACEGTNITLEQQKYIYESLTRASAFYHMSTERTRDMTTAIIQMASKGRITAEELRRQLGNNLPGAFNLMAAALKISTAQLDDLMKKGKIASEDALPKFAAMLNTITKGGNFDSLQMSLNRLKNTWTEMVDSAGFERMYKGIVDGANGVMQYMKYNFWPTIFGIGGSFVGLAAKNGFVKFRAQMKVNLAQMKKELADAQKNLKTLRTEVPSMPAYLKRQEGPYNARGFLLDTDRMNQTLTRKINMADVGATSKERLANLNAAMEEIKLQKKLYATTVKYNEELLKTNKLRKQIYGKGILPDVKEKELVKNLKVARTNLKEFEKATKTTVMETKPLAGVWRTVGGVIKSVGQTIASIGINALAMAIVGIATRAVGAWIEYNKRLKEARNLYNDYEKTVESTNVGVAENGALLMSQLRILRDTSNSEQSRINALQKINELTGSKYSVELIKQNDELNKQNAALGKTADAYQGIVKEVEKWIEATKIQAKVQVQAQQQANAEAEINRMETENRELHDKIANPKDFWEQFSRESFRKKIKVNEEAIEQYRAIAIRAGAALDELGVKLSDLYNNGSSGGGGDNPFDKGNTLKGIPKIMDEYKKSVDELNASLSQGIINQEDYQKQLDKLIIDTWEKAAKTGKLDINDIIAKMDKGGTLTAMEQWYYDIAKAARQAAQDALRNEFENGIIKDVEDYIKELDEQLKKTSERLGEANEADIKNLNRKMPDFKPRDTTFDYKNDTSDILEGEIKAQRDWAKVLEQDIKEIKDSYENLGDAGDDVIDKIHKMTAEMDKATATADNLEAAMKFYKIKEDVAELEKEIRSAFASGIKGLASDMDRVVKGMESIREADGSGWEQFMAIFNEITQIVDLVVGITNSIQKVSDTAKKLAGAELAQNVALVELQQKKVDLERQLFIWKSKNVGLTDTAIAKEAAEATASRANASAKASEAVAGATASGAKLAFPWNLAAIAAGIAAVLGALSAMNGFAKGGIIGGNSYSGDKQLARVNTGEMVINRGQQAKLWNFIKNGSNGFSGGEVQLRVRGTDLIGAIKNTESKMRG